jgi:mono/diheme cytochrome c family protein
MNLTTGAKLQRTVTVLALTFALIPFGQADEGHSDKKKADSAMHDDKKMGGMDMHGGKTHAHGTWVTPPEEFRFMRSVHWGDVAAVERGKGIYQQNCIMCHGTDGKGTGVVASSLEHAPADLTKHLHSSQINNDGYLFWRVTKGGTVDPFLSQKSAMPAYETSLTPEQRWDVLIYVHEIFHKGFVEERARANDGSSTKTAMGDGHKGKM